MKTQCDQVYRYNLIKNIYIQDLQQRNKPMMANIKAPKYE